MVHLQDSDLESILGRKIYTDLIEDAMNLNFDNCNILITGASGSIGEKLTEKFSKMNVAFTPTDIETLDVTRPETFPDGDFTHVVNIAGAKHAPAGEEHTEETFMINTQGVLNLLKKYDKSKHVLCSTCKSCNPETAYGATKLISERLVLNSGGSVARFYNVIETSGNVFEIWKNQEIINVASECNRFFITLDEATSLLMFSILKNGRFMVDTPRIRNMLDVASCLYPNRKKNLIYPRRGDRLSEKIYADHEYVSNKIHDKINQIISPND